MAQTVELSSQFLEYRLGSDGKKDHESSGDQGNCEPDEGFPSEPNTPILAPGPDKELLSTLQGTRARGICSSSHC